MIDHRLIMQKMLEVADLASNILLKNFHHLRHNDILYKQNDDCSSEIVTQVDIEVENVVINFLQNFFPDSHFIGEESSKDGDLSRLQNEKMVFVIDPIDGTSNYVYGIDQFCFSLGFMSEGEMIGGVIASPTSSEVFYGMKNCNAFYKKKDSIAQIDKIHENNFDKHHKYLIGATYPCVNLIYRKLSKKVSVRIIGSVALTIAYALIGKFDGFISNTAKIWDIAGGLGIAANIVNLNFYFKNYESKSVFAIHRKEEELAKLKKILSEDEVD